LAPTVERRKRGGPKRELIAAPGEFFPGEVVRILGLKDIDYRQLRDLANLVSPGRTSRGKWGRYTFEDLVKLRNAIELAGGYQALKLGKRLRIGHLSRVLVSLKAQFGVLNPLAELKLERVGTSILAHVSGAKLDPIDGQYVLSKIMVGVRTYLKRPPRRGRQKKLKEISRQKPKLRTRGFAVARTLKFPF
jgi:hypothetical protein